MTLTNRLRIQIFRDRLENDPSLIKIKDNKLIQSAYFYPKGVLGRLYWYALIPLHYFVFNNMIKSIIQKAKNLK